MKFILLNNVKIPTIVNLKIKLPGMSVGIVPNLFINSVYTWILMGKCKGRCVSFLSIFCLILPEILHKSSKILY